MAADYLQWEVGFDRKQKNLLMGGRLNVLPEFVACRVFRIWEWCDKNIPKEKIDPKTHDATVSIGIDPWAFFDAEAGLPGLTKAMAASDIDWFRFDGRTCTFPRLGLHLSKTAKTRGQATMRKRRQRQREEEEAEARRRGDVTPMSRTPNRDSHAPEREGEVEVEDPSFKESSFPEQKRGLRGHAGAREADRKKREAELLAELAADRSKEAP